MDPKQISEGIPLPSEGDFDIILEALDSYSRETASQIAINESVQAMIKASKSFQDRVSKDPTIKVTEEDIEKQAIMSVDNQKIKDRTNEAKAKITVLKAKVVRAKEYFKTRSLQDEIDEMTKA